MTCRPTVASLSRIIAPSHTRPVVHLVFVWYKARIACCSCDGADINVRKVVNYTATKIITIIIDGSAFSLIYRVCDLFATESINNSNSKKNFRLASAAAVDFGTSEALHEI